MPFFSFCTIFVLQTMPSSLLSSHLPSTVLALFPNPWHSPGVQHLPKSLRVQVTTALFAWVQGWSLEDPLRQEVRRDSFPTHCSSPSQMGLTPSPK